LNLDAVEIESRALDSPTRVAFTDERFHFNEADSKRRFYSGRVVWGMMPTPADGVLHLSLVDCTARV
jgi:hypothetical protein